MGEGGHDEEVASKKNRIEDEYNQRIPMVKLVE